MHKQVTGVQSDHPIAEPINGRRHIRLLYYISARDRTRFDHGFFGEEIAALRADAVVSSVHPTNRLIDVWTQDYDATISYFYSYSAIVAMIARLRGKRAIIIGGAEQIMREMAPNIRRYLIRMCLFFLTLFGAARFWPHRTATSGRCADWRSSSTTRSNFHFMEQWRQARLIWLISSARASEPP